LCVDWSPLGGTGLGASAGAASHRFAASCLYLPPARPCMPALHPLRPVPPFSPPSNFHTHISPQPPTSLHCHCRVRPPSPLLPPLPPRSRRCRVPRRSGQDPLRPPLRLAGFRHQPQDQLAGWVAAVGWWRHLVECIARSSAASCNPSTLTSLACALCSCAPQALASALRRGSSSGDRLASSTSTVGVGRRHRMAGVNGL
jgi:hypothetical protein